MSNLGGYQWLTTFCKKVGGPFVGTLIIAGAGYITGRSIEFGAKKALDKVKENLDTDKENCNNKPVQDNGNNVTEIEDPQKNTSDVNQLESIIKTVKKAGLDNQGLSFEPGDEIKVIDQDGDSVLIEKMGDDNNPYFIDAAFLNDITSEIGEIGQELNNGIEEDIVNNSDFTNEQEQKEEQ